MNALSRFDCRLFLSALAVGLAGLCWLSCAAKAVEVEPTVEGDVAWYNVSAWGVEGKGWPDTARYFDRLPGRAEATVRSAVWNLSRHSAGMSVRFRTDARTIHARYGLLSASLAISASGRGIFRVAIAPCIAK